MVEVTKDGGETPKRLCLCCGALSASRSIPACWGHWNALPEDLRSVIVVSQGRGQLKIYADSLFEAVKLWRGSGAWRSKYQKAAPWAGQATVAVAVESAVPAAVESQDEHRVISLLEHRQKSTARIAGRSGTVAPNERAAKSRT